MRKLCLGILVIGMLAKNASARWDLGDAADMLKKLPQKNSQDSQSNDNTPTSVATVRGLDEPEGSGDPKARDYKAVQRMEKVTVSKSELNKFIQDGGLRGAS